MLDLFSKFFCCCCYYFALIKQVVQVHCGKKKNLKGTNTKWKSTVIPTQNALQLHFGECVSERHSVMSNPLWTHELLPIRLLCPWDFSMQEYWSGLPFPSAGALPDPGIHSGFPTLQADSLPAGPPGKPTFWWMSLQMLPLGVFVYLSTIVHARHTLTHTHHKLWCIWWQVGEKSIEICWFKWWRGPSSRWRGFKGNDMGARWCHRGPAYVLFLLCFPCYQPHQGQVLSLMISGWVPSMSEKGYVHDRIQGEGLETFSGISFQQAKKYHDYTFPENTFSHLTLLRRITCPPQNQSGN